MKLWAVLLLASGSGVYLGIWTYLYYELRGSDGKGMDGSLSSGSGS